MPVAPARSTHDVTHIYVFAIAGVFFFLLYSFFPATVFDFYPKCFFYHLTGFLCPGCGSQRAASALLHGDVVDAVKCNLLFVLAIPYTLYTAGIYIHNTVSGKKTGLNHFGPANQKLFIVVIIVFWGLRNLPIFHS